MTPSKQLVSLAFIIQCISFLHSTNANASNELDAALLKTIMPAPGNKCKSNYETHSSTTTTESTFIHQPSPSYYDSTAASFEKDLFLVEMSHNNTVNNNQSWALRIGKSGSVYSFRGAYGEAIPPQFHRNGVFIDEVIQSVSVNLNKNAANGGTDPYYIHQAGIYTKDSPYTDTKFFSPNIVKHCDGNVECSVGSWGQQAHIQTIHKSDMLYFNSYRDCGEGVIEFTTVLHNTATEDGDPVSYLNVPWGGFRRRNLRDVFLANKDTGILEHKYPLPSFFDQVAPNFDSIGGFTTFAEQVKASDEAFNAMTSFQVPVVDGVSLKLVTTGSFRQDTTKSGLWNRPCFKVSLEPTIVVATGCEFCSLWFTNSRTGYKFYVPVVIHWAWAGNKIFFCSPERDLDDRDGGIVAASAAKLNEEISVGDEILVSLANVGKPIEENMALTHVHGREMSQSEVPSGVRWATSRVRYGWAGSARRDYNVWTANARVWVNPGDTYMFRQYIVTGELSGMEARSSPWVDEVYHDIFPLGEMTGGVDIHLYSNSNDIFGAYVEGGSSCLQGVSRCVGKSIPSFGMRPLYAVTCGNKKYVGSNQYVFSPARASETETIRSYACEGEAADVRPEWKLLGFFEEGSCMFLESATYDSEFCSTALPSSMPSVGPSIIPSLSPSLRPSEAPTYKPSGTPISEPSQPPSSKPSEYPTFEPSQPPSSKPSEYPTFEPSQPPSSKPSEYPTFEPSQYPTLKHSVNPSFDFSNLPTSRSGDLSSSTPSPSHISSQLQSVAPSFLITNFSSSSPSLSILVDIEETISQFNATEALTSQLLESLQLIAEAIMNTLFQWIRNFLDESNQDSLETIP